MNKVITILSLVLTSSTIFAANANAKSEATRESVFVGVAGQTVKPGLMNISTGCADAKNYAISKAKISCYEEGYESCKVLDVTVLGASTASGGDYAQVGGCQAKALVKGSILSSAATYIETSQVSVDPGLFNLSSGCGKAKKRAFGLALSQCIERERGACSEVETLVTHSSTAVGGDYSQVGGCRATSIARPDK